MGKFFQNADANLMLGIFKSLISRVCFTLKQLELKKSIFSLNFNLLPTLNHRFPHFNTGDSNKPGLELCLQS